MSVVGFVDNITVFVEGQTSEENCNQLLHIYKTIGKLLAHCPGSKFAPDKYQLLHLTQKRIAILDHPLILPKQTIFPTQIITYLGVVLDTKLL